MVHILKSAGCLLLGAANLVLATRQLPFNVAANVAVQTQNEPMLTIELPFGPSSMGFSQSLKPDQLIAAQNGSFARLIHRDFPETSVRIKRHAPAREKGLHAEELDPNAFCDPTVASWTGYIDTIDGRSLFFFFFESRSSPAEDPVVMWTNGGPGSSSSIGLFMEHGPCRAVKERRPGPPINGTDYFEPSWNTRANMVYIEQPAGVGYSYVRFGDPVYDTVKASRDVYQFFRIFFAAFEQFRSNDFHLSGESYGGRYLPEFAREIVDNDHRIINEARKQGKEPEPGTLLNLKSVIIGNGVMTGTLRLPATYDTICTSMGEEGPPKLTIGECAALKPWIARCVKNIKKHCEEDYSEELCALHTNGCSAASSDITTTHNYNPYDMHDPCEAGMERLCFWETEWIESYLDRDDVRSLLGAAPRSEIGPYKSSSYEMLLGFDLVGDRRHTSNSFDLNALLLERGVKILIYAGKADTVCPWLMSLRAVDQMEYSHSINFAQSLEDWYSEGKVIGKTAAGGNLTLVSINGAGHMVPYRLEHAWPALDMFNRWLSGERI